jgi:hypothetical protein
MIRVTTNAIAGASEMSTEGTPAKHKFKYGGNRIHTRRLHALPG